MFARMSLNQKGFSFVEVMIATAMMTIAGIAVVSLSQLANQDSLQLRATRVVMTARSEIEAALKNPVSWQQTLAQNSSFKCASTGCNVAPGGGYYDFVVYGTQPGTKVSYDPTDGTSRYSIQGGACPAGADSSDSRCPLKYVARWKPICQTYPCINPTLDIQISLVTEFGSKAPPLYAEKYQVSTVRGIGDGSLQSACQTLNGTYNAINNTCYPKNAGKTCGAGEVISSVDANGNLTCVPFYSGTCDSATQIMSGIDANGKVQCAPRSQPANCPIACVGAWNSCLPSCGTGRVKTYVMVSPAKNGGDDCLLPAPGATQACPDLPCPVKCVGHWVGCDVLCGGGSDRYQVDIPAANGGDPCPNYNGESIRCNTQACAVPVDCGGSWSACNPATGTQTFTITQAPQDGGKACPASLTQNCPVDCAGSWGACGGAAAPYKTYTWTTLPRNGGSAATCAYPNGQTDPVGCGGAAKCSTTVLDGCDVGTMNSRKISLTGTTWNCRASDNIDVSCGANHGSCGNEKYNNYKASKEEIKEMRREEYWEIGCIGNSSPHSMMKTWRCQCTFSGCSKVRDGKGGSCV